MTQRLPRILAERALAGGVELDIEVAPGLEYFAGHFPGAPLLPAVVQVDWAIRIARERWHEPGPFRTLEQLKFQAPVQPGARLTLALAYDATRRRLTFSYRDSRRTYSSGRVGFAQPTFAPCIVIPIYNHGEAIASTVEKLSPYGVPIYVVDDGSDAATRDALSAIAFAQPRVRLHHLPANRGKGAAVMEGMRIARAAGHSHALQIDADGQHDSADVPQFLAQARACPEAVICGAPMFDRSAPAARRYGRYATHVWVWIETLSFQIRDALCGYRVYPLAATCRLIDRVTIPTRMDFDVEILVRLVWAGLPVVNVPTRVTYPPGGRSHFRLVRDNLRLTWMHTRLVCGMLARLPRLLALRRTAGIR